MPSTSTLAFKAPSLGLLATEPLRAVLEFCSAKLSRETREADPRNIVFCPYGIAVYTLPKEPGRVYVAYRRQGAPGAGGSAKALQAVDRFLADIIAEALK